MRWRPDLILLVASLLSAFPAHADIVIRCFGYNRAINDHVEWDLQITGDHAAFGKKQYSVTESKRYLTLIGPAGTIRIDKVKKSYVMWGPKGSKTRAIEWSRKVSSEGCEIPKAG